MVTGDVSKEVLTVTQVAELLQVPRDWVISHANGKRRPILPNFKVGRMVRFYRGDIEQFIANCSRGANSANTGKRPNGIH